MKNNFVRLLVKIKPTWYYAFKHWRERGKGKKMCKIFDPLLASNNFIERAKNDKIDISPMKLQKLLYFLYRDYLHQTGDPLFSDRFETWQYGPVLSCVYHAFRNYGSNSISDFYVDSEGKARKIHDAVNDVFARTLNTVWDKYKPFSGMELSRMTHEPHTAWYKSWMNDDVFLLDDDIKAEANYEQEG